MKSIIGDVASEERSTKTWTGRMLRSVLRIAKSAFFGVDLLFPSGHFCRRNRIGTLFANADEYCSEVRLSDVLEYEFGKSTSNPQWRSMARIQPSSNISILGPCSRHAVMQKKVASVASKATPPTARPMRHGHERFSPESRATASVFRALRCASSSEAGRTSGRWGVVRSEG